MSDYLLRRYHYEEFRVDTAMIWLNFKNSPPLGEAAPDFPLWALDGRETSLSNIWLQHAFTIVEFGSFT